MGDHIKISDMNRSNILEKRNLRSFRPIKKQFRGNRELPRQFTDYRGENEMVWFTHELSYS